MPRKSTNTPQGQRIALTGGTGFLGGHVIESLLAAGHKITALTRKPQIARDGITWIDGSLTDTDSLAKLCASADILINLAGLTKAVNRDIFFDINVTATKNVFDAAAKAAVKRVIHISSLTAREPRLSHYGASKAGTELLLTARQWPFSWTIVRAPAIYGPGDKEILKLLKATKFGILPAPGSTENRFSMIHARDLADALTALSAGGFGSAILEIDDGKNRGYQLKDIAEALSEKGGKPAKTFSLPYWAIGTIGALNGLFASAINRPAMLTLSTARYLCHKDWTVREPRRPHLPNWSPQFDLIAGLKDTTDWYRKNGLL
jgi:nucleoside-diphosphate-sugar epimerase